MSADNSFLIMAAGSGTRLGGAPKQFRPLGRRSVWMWSLDIADRLYRAGRTSECVVVLPKAYLNIEVPSGYDVPIKFVSGGDVRSASVLNGIRAASGRFVTIHDAARPFLSIELCCRLLDTAEKTGTAVPVIRSVDSLKEIDDTSVRIVDRNKIYRTQTPQCFDRVRLIDAMERMTAEATDESSVWSANIGDVSYVDGEEKNFKITTDFDWQMASSLASSAREVRTGFGYDVHELVPERQLVLGGVHVPSSLGLLGHSDADIICHSISDALLGAAGEGDIGTLFPASDNKYKDADSMMLMLEVAKLIRAAGWNIVWIDVTLVAQTPRLADTIPHIADNLSNVFTRFGLEDTLSVKVKSGERVGAVGRGECMICHTVATIERYRL